MTDSRVYRLGYRTALVWSAVRHPREFIRIRLWEEWH